MRVFLADLRQSIAAMRRDIRLPLLSLSLFLVTVIPSVLPLPLQTFLGVLVLPVSIFMTGYVGAERIWFARLFAGGAGSASR